MPPIKSVSRALESDERGDNPGSYWLEVKDDGGKLTAKFLDRGGHPTEGENVRVEGDELIFLHGTGTQPKAEFRGKVTGNKLTATVKRETVASS